MQDRTIDNALLALRKQVIREGTEGQDHVEALLQMRGVDMPHVLPAKRKDVAGKGLMARLVLESLRDGPKPLREVVSHVARHRPELDYRAAYIRTTQALARMKGRGLVRRDGRVWLAP